MFISKKIVGLIANLVYILKKNNYKYSKTKAKSKNKYFNYYKIGYFSQNCKFFDYYIKKKNNNSRSSIKLDQENNLSKLQPQQANTITNIVDNDNSKSELFCFKKALMTMKFSIIL